MKTLTVIFLGGMVLVAGSPAFAGRDETQMIPLRQAMAAKQANQLAQAKQAQTGLAGPTGIPGKVGPEGQRTRPTRDPSAHP